MHLESSTINVNHGELTFNLGHALIGGDREDTTQEDQEFKKERAKFERECGKLSAAIHKLQRTVTARSERIKDVMSLVGCIHRCSQMIIAY
jgi:hypothetical protein